MKRNHTLKIVGVNENFAGILLKTPWFSGKTAYGRNQPTRCEKYFIDSSSRLSKVHLHQRPGDVKKPTKSQYS